MSDDLNKKGFQDRSRININEAHEVSYWTDYNTIYLRNSFNQQ
ncbi:MAG: DUF3606 domain-containing protein [Flavobacterium sp.]